MEEPGHAENRPPDGHHGGSAQGHVAREAYVPLATFQKALKRIDRLEALLQETLRKDRARFGKLEDGIRVVGERDRDHQASLTELLQQVDHLGEDVVKTSQKLLDEKHRIANAADHAMRAVGKVEEVSTSLSTTKEALRRDLGRLARGLQALDAKIETVQQESRESKQASRKDARAAGGALLNAADLQRLDEALLQVKENTAMVKQVMQAQRELRVQIGHYVKKEELTEVKANILHLDSKGHLLEKHFIDQLFALKKKRLEEAIATFSHRWTPHKKRQVLKMAFHCWFDFLQQQNRAREALRRTQQLYTNAHTTHRLRSWLYIMQKHGQKQQMSHFAEWAKGQEAQFEVVQVSVSRLEKSFSEQLKSFQHRMLSVEKVLDNLEAKKASQQAVNEKFKEVERAIDEERSRLDGVQEKVANLSLSLKNVEDRQLTPADLEPDRRKAAHMEGEMRAALMRIDEVLKFKADVAECNQKADTVIVEQVILMLSHQVDQLATLVTHDLEEVRQSISRFLELSPDVRKAALGVMLEGNMECASCRPMGRKALLDPVMGYDGAMYRPSPDTNLAVTEQVRKIVAEKLRYPSVMMTSMLLGTALQQLPPASPSPTSAPSVTPRRSEVHGQQLPVLTRLPQGWTPVQEEQRQELAAPPPERAAVAQSYFPASAAAAVAAGTLTPGTPRNKLEGFRRN